MTLKISVLASGAILADGQPVGPSRLAELLRELKAANGIVWYFREAAAGSEAAGMMVIKLVAEHKLACSVSSKRDFSDYLDAKGVSHPRGEGAVANGPRMPEVAVAGDIEEVFAKVRQAAAGEGGPRGLVLVRPDRRFLLMPALEASPQLTEMAAGMERMIPSDVKRNIAVIADTAFAAGAAPDLEQASKGIPFLGLLTGLSYIGHSVWVFEGHASALTAGCRQADVLIVDGAMTKHLMKGWEETAAAVMRNANILVHDRSSFKLRFVRRVGERSDRLQFRPA
jgi:hypothetical protein